MALANATAALRRSTSAVRDAGALQLRLVGVKNSDPATEEQAFKVTDDAGRERYDPNVVLDLDYTVLIPRRR